MPFEFGTSKCSDCGYEYFLTLWYRLSVHTFFWCIGALYFVFKYIIDPRSSDAWVVVTILSLLLLMPLISWAVSYYKFRDVPADNAVTLVHKSLFWVLTLVTAVPVILYLSGA
ncbi:MAG: hypothetical protein COA42_15200 [Alteromonadaceae bacterium]|nr:MAG: hypothetical protein COA42_15200 [Alteromonadaceae bacterium]